MRVAAWCHLVQFYHVKPPAAPAWVMPSFLVRVSPSASSSHFCSGEKAFLMFLFPTLLLYVPSNRSWKIPSFLPSLKTPRRTAWRVISNYSISHSVQWKHPQFIRQRGLDQMDHQLLSFSMSGSSFQSNYLVLGFSLYLTTRSTLNMGNGLHPQKQNKTKEKTTGLYIKTMNSKNRVWLRKRC